MKITISKIVSTISVVFSPIMGQVWKNPHEDEHTSSLQGQFEHAVSICKSQLSLVENLRRIGAAKWKFKLPAEGKVSLTHEVLLRY